jgi:hypothetical protein
MEDAVRTRLAQESAEVVLELLQAVAVQVWRRARQREHRRHDLVLGALECLPALYLDELWSAEAGPAEDLVLAARRTVRQRPLAGPPLAAEIAPDEFRDLLAWCCTPFDPFVCGRADMHNRSVAGEHMANHACHQSSIEPVERLCERDQPLGSEPGWQVLGAQASPGHGGDPGPYPVALGHPHHAGVGIDAGRPLEHRRQQQRQ